MALTVNTGDCIGCGICIDECPNDALALEGDVAVLTNADACIECGICVDACPQGALAL